MSITIEQAKALNPGDMLHHDTFKNADGSCQRWKVNGIPQTWKRDPNRVRVPVKHGLKSYDQITNSELHLVHLAKDCPDCMNNH